MSEAPLQKSLVHQLLTQVPHGKFDRDEKQQHWHTKKLDALGMCLILGVYIGVSWRCGTEVIPEESSPFSVLACQTIMVVLSVYNVYVEFYILPRGTKDGEDDFYVTYGPFGRWVYLTHQTIGLLAVHSVVSVLSLLSPSRRLANGTYAATPVIGAAGVFVTVQYFNLVFPQKDHKKTCKMWAERGVRFGFIDGMRHALPMLVVALDVVAKHRATLILAMPSVYGIILFNVVYVLSFVFLTHLNYAITGYWQYAFMKALGQSPKNWLMFIAVQGSVLSGCGLFLSLLARSISLW
eukprot:Skav211924  [mRNA]  locus=scaffold1086:97706:98587:+ [translate_table: standard]